MEYNERGKRLVAERKKLGLSQSALTDTLRERCPVGRNTLSALENGKESVWENVSLGFLQCLCDVFGCDLGYLLGMYPEHTIENKIARDHTGLTEKAVENLHEIASWSNRESESLMLFLESEHFFDFVTSLSNCYRHYENLAKMQSDAKIELSGNPEMERYRKERNALQLEEIDKNGKDAVSFAVNRASVRLADYMLQLSKERWGKHGTKEQS